MNTRPKKIMFLGAGFSTRNMGVWALASGAITTALHSFPDAELYILDYNLTPERYEVKHSGVTSVVNLINIRYSKKFWIQNNIALLMFLTLLAKLIPFRFIRDRLISDNFCLSHIKNADFVGSIAGGDSFSDIYGIDRLVYVALPQILTIIMGKKLILLPQTIGPFKSSFGKAVARYILRRALKVFARDLGSIDAARRLFEPADRQVEFCYDLGFVLEPHIGNQRIPGWLTERNNNVLLVGLNVSGLLYIGGYTQNNMFRLKCDYRKLIHDLIDYFVREHKAEVVLVPHVLGTAENKESDMAACSEIFNEVKQEFRSHLHLIEEGYDHHELKAIIGRCDFFLGSRMHACIAALSQCVPAIGLAYSRKFRGVFSSIGMEDLVIDLRNKNGDSALILVDRILHRHLEIRDYLEKTIPEVRARVMDLFKLGIFQKR